MMYSVRTSLKRDIHCILRTHCTTRVHTILEYGNMRNKNFQRKQFLTIEFSNDIVKSFLIHFQIQLYYILIRKYFIFLLLKTEAY